MRQVGWGTCWEGGRTKQAGAESHNAERQSRLSEESVRRGSFRESAGQALDQPLGKGLKEPSRRALIGWAAQEGVAWLPVSYAPHSERSEGHFCG